MEKETLKSIMRFLENEENKTSFKWKLLNDEPFTEEELNIKGNLDLDGTEIRTLPKGLKVGGDLNLYRSKITSLPDDLHIGGGLVLQNSKIKSLPKGLKVHGFLFITNTPLLNFSDEDLRKMIKPTDDDDGYIDRKIIRE